MSEDIAGIARNSCPLCGELTRVPGDQFFNFGVTTFFRCSACEGRIRVAPSTRIAAGFGGLLGLAPGLYAWPRLSAWLDRIGWHPHPTTFGGGFLFVGLFLGTFFAGYALAAVTLWRLTIRLEPANL